MSENVQLASMLMAPGGSNRLPVSSRKDTTPQSAQAAEGQSVQRDAEGTTRDSASYGQKKTAFDKVLNQRLEKRPEDTAETAETETVETAAQPLTATVNPQAEVLLAKILAQFGRPFETPTAGQGYGSAQQGTASPVSVKPQAQSAAMVQSGAAISAAVVTSGTTHGTSMQVVDSAKLTPLAAEEKPAAQNADATSPTSLTSDTKPLSEKTAIQQPVQPVQASVAQPSADKTPASQAVEAAAASARQMGPQFKENQAESGTFQLKGQGVEQAGEPEKAVTAKSETPALTAEKTAAGGHVGTSIVSDAQIAAHDATIAAAGGAHAVQTKDAAPDTTDKPTFSVTETAEVSKLRASDPVTASRTVDQIAQKLSLEQPIRVDQQIRLTLSPQEQGTVRITFREQGSEIVGLLEVQKPETRKELEDSMPQLLSSLQSQGVQVRRVEVVQWNTPQQQSRDSLADNFNPSAEREFLQQRMGQPGGGSSNQRGFSQSEGFAEGRSNSSATDAPASSQWFNDNGLNLYI